MYANKLRELLFSINLVLTSGYILMFFGNRSQSCFIIIYLIRLNYITENGLLIATKRKKISAVCIICRIETTRRGLTLV